MPILASVLRPDEAPLAAEELLAGAEEVVEPAAALEDAEDAGLVVAVLLDVDTAATTLWLAVLLIAVGAEEVGSGVVERVDAVDVVVIVTVDESVVLELPEATGVAVAHIDEA
jgi:hypothetical protein